MLIQPYRADELRFAWCHRVYLRWRTHRLQSHPPLAKLNQAVLDAILQQYDIRVLEHRADETDVLLLVSLSPQETVSACVGKCKGQISKWLREQLRLDKPANLLSRGYFAATTGQSTPQAVEDYLAKQGEHHGYADRVRPPVIVQRYELAPADEQQLKPQHAFAMLQHHIVLATSWRRGVFTQEAGEAVADHWRGVLREARAALLKVSFLPDHVHAAVRVHPGVSPAELIVRMMNSAQELMFARFKANVIRARVERLWQPSAYLGAYGDLASPQISRYIRNWNDEIRGE